jgi:hypothetical protein
LFGAAEGGAQRRGGRLDPVRAYWEIRELAEKYRANGVPQQFCWPNTYSDSGGIGAAAWNLEWRAAMRGKWLNKIR